MSSHRLLHPSSCCLHISLSFSPGGVTQYNWCVLICATAKTPSSQPSRQFPRPNDADAMQLFINSTKTTEVYLLL